MDVLFKYLSSASVEEVVRHARIRIGTLHEYRDGDHPRQVADSKEGRHTIVVDRNAAGGPSTQAVRAQFQPPTGDQERSGKPRVVCQDERRIVLEERSPDLYLYSASLRCDLELMRQLQYDSCVRISDPERFFAALTRELGETARFLGFRRVIYEDPQRPQPHEAGVAPAFYKRAEFAHQAEVRALWKPRASQIQPIVVTSREAAALCTPWLSVLQREGRDAHARRSPGNRPA